MFLVQSFRLKDERLQPDRPQRFASAQEAIATTQRLADRAAGVVVLLTTVDFDAEITGKPNVLYRHGQVPLPMRE
jgi:hypothetical protein